MNQSHKIIQIPKMDILYSVIFRLYSKDIVKPVDYITNKLCYNHITTKFNLGNTAVARTLVGGGGFIRIFMFCPISFF